MNTAQFIEHDDVETQRYIEAVKDGLRAADDGQVRPYDEVRKWLLSWGTGTE